MGLTRRQQEKKYKEEKVKELIQQGFNKSQIAKELGLNRSTITKSYSHLFN
ncbi:helix-turn-helix domain-containing protein [Clostridium tetani]|uniref:helix-turn-helix domain-containing protein n=1 Tax=Clostridium tetani TaxID=1513 RepID=UPI0009B886BD|nr:helix-turn-helix domain-containing protein [Clostridium tetani]